MLETDPEIDLSDLAIESEEFENDLIITFRMKLNTLIHVNRTDVPVITAMHHILADMIKIVTDKCLGKLTEDNFQVLRFSHFPPDDIGTDKA